jgi:hypothetical protein
VVLQVLRALADHYVANINRFAGDGSYDPTGRLAIQGAAKRDQYVGFLRGTIETVFRARRWDMTAVLDKLASAGALLRTEKDRHTKKVSVESMQHRMICVKWSALQLEDAVTESPPAIKGID